MFNITTEQMRFWSPEVRELEPYVPGEQPKIQNLLKLNTNENPYPPSPKVVEAVQAVLENSADVLRLYPDPDASALKQAIAKQQNVAVENVFVGNGSDEVLAHIFKAFFVQAILFIANFLGSKPKFYHSMMTLKLWWMTINKPMAALLSPIQMHQPVLILV